jgi:hypothetical protein
VLSSRYDWASLGTLGDLLQEVPYDTKGHTHS